MSATFDKRLAELDAYLQMLIVENEAIDRKLDSLTISTTNTPVNTEREGLLTIRNNLKTLLSSIEHSIVLLQIAKVSLKTSNSSHNSESSEATTPPPPNIPPRLSKSNSSTPKSKAHNSSRLAEDQAANDLSNTLSSKDHPLGHKSSTTKQHSHEHNSHPLSSQKSAATSSAASGSLDVNALSGAKSSRHQPSELNANSTDGSVVSAGIGCDTTPASGQADTVGLASRSENFRSQCGRNDSNCREVYRDNDDGDDDDAEEEDDAFFDAADEQVSRTIACPEQNSRNNSIESTSTTNNNNNNNNEIIIDDKYATNLLKDLSSNSSSVRKGDELALRRNSSAPPTTTMPTNNVANKDTNNTDGASIDWDALYEDEDEEDLSSLEGQGSVIKHLLSQIRIGMDLTKVVLPTFILERRSLLEMYADFFAHPDLFSAIPDYQTAEERMVQLVRWYLSAFHAGRKSSVAKKPYNPILGEIFKCHWELNSTKHEAKLAKSNENSRNLPLNDESVDGQKLTFIAEQVSHHPPVSAFYAENKEKSISCCSHIYTKSKYLGLSVGVNNIGTGVIKLPKYNETYVCTFPSAYGRSILTVSWFELGGPVSIECNETGYKANIEFVTKPFYGGKKHRVMGEILRPNNECFLTIDGEWNGVMYSKSMPISSDKQVFVDTTNLPVIKKHVSPVSTQESFESRNVWKEVTRALKLQDINTATAAKSFIEQRQRDLLKDRLEKGVKWRTRYFEACDDGWTYSGPPANCSKSGGSDL